MAALCVCVMLLGGGAAAFILTQERPPETTQTERAVSDNEPLPTATPLPETAPPTEAADAAFEPPTEAVPPTDPPVEESAVEPGGSLKTAQPITPGSYSSDLTSRQAEHWYRFDAAAGQIVQVALTPGGDAGKMEMILSDAERGQSWNVYNVAPPTTVPIRRMLGLAAGGVYYVQVKPYASDGGSYTLDLTLENQNDAEAGSDAGDDIDQAVTIPLAVGSSHTISAQVGDFDADDWFQVEVPNGHIVMMSVSPQGESKALEVSMFGPSGQQVWNVYNLRPPEKAGVKGIMNSTMGGAFSVQVTTYGGQGGVREYTLDFTLESQNDAGSGGDAGDEQVQGLEISPGQPISGLVGNHDEFDCYKFTPAVGQTISFTPGAETEGMIIQLFNSDIREIWQENRIPPTVSKTHQLETVNGGPYYICVGNAGTYTLEIRP